MKIVYWILGIVVVLVLILFFVPIVGKSGWQNFKGAGATWKGSANNPKSINPDKN